MTRIPYNSDLDGALLALWRAAAGDRHPLTPGLLAALTRDDPHFRADDAILYAEGDALAGFAIAKRYRGDFPGCERQREWLHLALLAVAPERRRRGLATRMLAEVGPGPVRAGGGFHHAMPGVSAAFPEALAFFRARGFAPGQAVWDVRADLSAVELPEVSAAGFALRPYRPDEAAALVAFLQEAFPGRWARDVAVFLDRGGPAEQVMGAFSGDRPVGFAWLHPPGAPGALRWAGFEPQVAALGPIGVAASVRGRGLGLALLVAGLKRLQELGAADTVIDWTTLLDFYGRCGFRPWLSYTLMERP